MAFAGAGISAESGIPPFRGKDGLWNKYDPIYLDIDYFQEHPGESWNVIKQIFYDFFGKAKPNAVSTMKPDFVFFVEPIPVPAATTSLQEATKAEILILIGTTGEIMPASFIPFETKKNTNTIIEINPVPSNYTQTITDIFLQGKATAVLQQLRAEIIKA